MISIVVPTMWKFAPFPDFLSEMADHHQVSDVILVNNSRDNTCAHRVMEHPKVTVFDFGQNIFVNPSWNLGMMHATSDLVCIVNDDVIFDLRLFDRIIEHWQDDHGVYGLCHLDHDGEDIKFLEHTSQNVFGFGQLMFVGKKNWIDIPPELNVYYGDNFIFDYHKIKFNRNFLIANLLHYTPHAQTTRDFGSFLNQEGIEYAKICSDMKIYRIHL